jgi:small redox-active disulfide protein 2
MKIEVLGSGCKKCHALEEQTRAALNDLGLAAEVEHVSDVKRIAGYGVLSTPALVIDGKVKCAGRSPAAEELKKWLQS